MAVRMQAGPPPIGTFLVADFGREVPKHRFFPVVMADEVAKIARLPKKDQADVLAVVLLAKRVFADVGGVTLQDVWKRRKIGEYKPRPFGGYKRGRVPDPGPSEDEDDVD